MSDKEIVIVMPNDLREIVAPYLEQRSSDEGYIYRTVWRDEPIGERELIKELAQAEGYVW
jgi:predicted homoserine dehydrogenase-like protein